MPLPEPGEQEGESTKAGREPAPEPSTDIVSTAPRKHKDFSKLVLLTASKDSTNVAGAKRKGIHCIMSLGVPGPATLAKALLKTHPEAQRALEAPWEPEQKRSKLDPDAEGKEDGRLTGRPAPRPAVEGEGPLCPHTQSPRAQRSFCVHTPSLNLVDGRLSQGSCPADQAPTEFHFQYCVSFFNQA